MTPFEFCSPSWSSPWLPAPPPLRAALRPGVARVLCGARRVCIPPHSCRIALASTCRGFVLQDCGPASRGASPQGGLYVEKLTNIKVSYDRSSGPIPLRSKQSLSNFFILVNKKLCVTLNKFHQLIDQSKLDNIILEVIFYSAVLLQLIQVILV